MAVEIDSIDQNSDADVAARIRLKYDRARTRNVRERHAV